MNHTTRPLLALILSLALATGMALAHGDHGHGSAHGHAHGHAHGEADEHHEDHDDHDHGHDEDDHEHGHDEDDREHGHGHDHEHGDLAGVRILVAAIDSPELVVLDAADGDVLARFTTPGPGRVYGLPNAQLAAVVHRDANRVTFVHSGLTVVDHGDHMDLLQGSPYVLKTVNVGRQPAHFFARGHDIAIFNDADGSMVWLDARLLGISLDFDEFPGTAPDHGTLAVLDGHLLGGYLQPGTVTVFERDGTEVETFEGCPRLHGQAVHGRFAVFGCSDGLLIVEAEGDGAFTSYKVTNPAGSPEDARVGTLVADEDAERIVGNFGRGIALIDPEARTMTTYELDAPPVGMRFAEHGELLVVLTLDGMLHDIDPANGQVRRSVGVMHAAASGAPRPALAVLGEHAFVTDPEHDRLVVVDLHDLEVEGRFELPFTPGGVAVMAIPGAVIH